MNSATLTFDLNALRIPKTTPMRFPGLISPIEGVAEEGIYPNAPRVVTRIYWRAQQVISILDASSSVYMKEIIDGLRWVHVPFEQHTKEELCVDNNALLAATGLHLLDVLAKEGWITERSTQLYVTFMALRYKGASKVLFMPNPSAASLGKPAWIVKDVTPLAAVA